MEAGQDITKRCALCRMPLTDSLENVLQGAGGLLGTKHLQAVESGMQDWLLQLAWQVIGLNLARFCSLQSCCSAVAVAGEQSQEKLKMGSICC